MGDSLFVHGGVTSAQEARLALAGLLAPQGAGLDVRTGVMHGPGATTLVTGTSATAPMRVAVGVHDGVSTRSAANGPYLMPTESTVLVDIAAAPGSGTRIDIVYEKQQDNTSTVPTPDATTGPLYGVKQGTVGAGKPTLDVVGALEIATVSVSAGATATNGAGVVITNTARLTVARGADVPVRDQAERDALTLYPGIAVKRLDLGGARQWHDGTRWYGTRGDAPTVSARIPNVAVGDLGSGASVNLQSTQTVPAAPFGAGVAYRIDVDASVRVTLPPGLGARLDLVVDGTVIGDDYFTNGGTTNCTVKLKARDFAYVADNSSHAVTAVLTALAGQIAVASTRGRLLIEARPYTGLS